MEKWKRRKTETVKAKNIENTNILIFMMIDIILDLYYVMQSETLAFKTHKEE